MRLTIILTYISLFLFTQLNGQQIHFKDKPLPCIEQTLKIQVHLVQNENRQFNIETDAILAQQEYLNGIFSPICVDFEFLEINVIENYQYDSIALEGEWAELQVLHNNPLAINVFFVEDFSFLYDINGTATQNGFALQEGAILIEKYPFVNEDPADLAHQLGHFFGLLNTYEANGAELVDGSNCDIEGDLHCDTPADNYDPQNNHEDILRNFLNTDLLPCRFIDSQTDANGDFYCPDVGNIMSNYAINARGSEFLECRCGFSQGQYRFMAERILSVRGM